jgi:hypothetical protein
MNLCIFRPIIFYGFLVSGFAGDDYAASSDSERLVSGFAGDDSAVSSDSERTETTLLKSAKGMTTPKKVGFRESVAVGRTEYDDDEVLETTHVNTTDICEQSLKGLDPRKEEDAQPRESAYNFVASINSMLYENGIPTDDPLIREAIKDRVLKIAKGIQGDFFVNRAVAQKEGSRPRLHILEGNFLKIAPETVEKMRAMGGLLALEDCLIIKEIARNNPSVIAALIALEQEKFDTIAQLNKRNISITADIFDAVSCRANTLTTDEIDLFLHFSVGSRIVFLELLKMPHHRVQDFKKILELNTMELNVNKALLNKSANEVLKIAKESAPGAQLCASDVLALAQRCLSRHDLSTYELIDFARVVIKRKSWWALMWTWVDHDTLHDLCDRQRSAQSS